jgi:hypothetical protein
MLCNAPDRYVDRYVSSISGKEYTLIAPSFINSHSLFLVMPNHLGPFHKTPDMKEVSRTER